MSTRYQLDSLGDHDLVVGLSALVQVERSALADVLAHIAEVDSRKLFLMYGCASMYVYCTEILGLSESGALTRIRAARLARDWPGVFDDVATGRLNLSGINALAAHVSGGGDDAGALLEAARDKSTRVIRELVAGADPGPDVPDSIRPIAVDRVVVRFTASQRFDDKLQQARALLSHSLPDMRFEHVLERALDLVIDEAERTRFAQTDAPRQGRPGGERNRHIPAAVKRAVIARDGDRCRFVGVNGRRCGERAFVQFHHDDVYALGGEHAPEVIHMMCAGHNRYLAEQVFGRAQLARCVSGPGADKVSGELAPMRVNRTAASSVAARPEHPACAVPTC